MMKHFKTFFTLLVCAGLLSGCLNIPPQPTETGQVDIVATNTIPPVATHDPTLIPDLPSPASALEPTATPPSLPALMPRKHPSAYQLTKPSPEGLLALIDALNTQYVYFGRQYDSAGHLTFQSMLAELANLFAIIDAEASLYYPDGFPNPEVVWKYYPFTSRDGYPAFPSVYLDSLTNAVFADFNDHPEHLQNQGAIDGKGYTVEVHQIELDHDPQPEWLVQIIWEEIAALSWLVLDQTSDQTYTKLKGSLPDIPWLIPTSTVTVEALQDFTGDGLTDIISVEQGYMFGTDSYHFYIAKGTSDGFEELRSIDRAISVTNFSDEPAYTLATPAGSKWLTLTLSDPHRLNWGCAWNTYSSYRWPHGNEVMSTTGEAMPQTPECFLAQAVRLYDPVDNSTAIQLLEKAIARFDTKDENQAGKSLFAHYRLAILYALADHDSLSRRHLQWFSDHVPASSQHLKQNLASFLEQPKLNAISLCDRLYNASASDIPPAWENYIDATAAVHAYPLSSEVYPPAICPLRQIIADELARVDLTLQPAPEKALAEQGIPILSFNTYPFPNQEQSASFVLLGEKTPYLAAYAPARDGWRWEILEEFDSAEAPPQVFSEDVTADGFPELVYSQPYRYWSCPEKEQGYKILLTTSAGAGIISLTHKVCSRVDELFDPAAYLPDKNRDGIVDWVADQIREYAGDSALTAERMGPATWFTPDEIAALFPAGSSNDETADEIDELTDKLYQGKDMSTLRQKLIAERDALNSTEPLADWQWQRLTYLIAVSYEMEGQADQAIGAFTSILHANRKTLWGNLAELHLTAK